MGTNPTAVQVHHSPRDGQPEADSAEAMLAREGALIERQENLFERLGLDADARIGDFDAQPPRAFRLLFVAGVNGNPPEPGREFHGIAQQVPDDLLKAGGVDPEPAVVSGKVAFEGDSLALGVIAHNREGEADQEMRVAPLEPQREFAARDRGQVEQVVDEPRFEQDIALDHGELFAGVGRESRVFAQEGGGDQHGRQRGAQLVRQRGEKFILRAARPFEGALRIFHFGHVRA